MEMLFNQNHPSAKNQQSQDQHPCSDCERTGAAALPDISAFANSQAASSARSIQIPFPWAHQTGIYQPKEEHADLRGFMEEFFPHKESRNF